MKSSKKKRVSFDLSGLSSNGGVEDEETSSGESEVGNEESDSTEERDYEVNDTRQLVLQHNRKKKKSGGFQSMGLSFAVFKGIMKKGYRVPTPIQRKTIPLILDGKDVVAMARTGSGKTAAFLLPLFEKLKVHSTKIGFRGLILSPTRELANQTMKFVKELGRFTGLRAAVVLGGDKMDDQFSALHENPDIVVATPGRFLHLVVEMDLKLSSVEYVVFDEADRLFEMGFSEQLKEIIRRLPEMRQTLLFSATLPKLLVEFAKAGLKDPVLIRLDVDNKLSDQLRLGFFHCRPDDKPALLLHFVRGVIPPEEQTVVFVATKHDVEYLRQLLLEAGIDSSFVYSSLDQTARKISVGKFVHKKTRIMLVTDVAARGIDIPLLDNVINYNFPSKPKLFVHRVGRVARAGRSGTAYSFVSPDEVPYVIDLHLFLGRTLTTTGKDGVFGSVPQSIIDDEEDFLRHTHSINSDLSSLKQVAANGMKQYIRSRNPPAPESIKRAKDIQFPLPLHPLFKEQFSVSEAQRSLLLDSLKSYKPSQTIFEINSNVRGQGKGIMKLKREAHRRIVSAVREKRREKEKNQVIYNDSSDDGGVVRGCGMAMSTEEDLKSFQTLTSSDPNPSAKKFAVHQKHQPYISYTPSDHHSEKGLSVEKTVSFNQQATGAVLDMMGDENEGMKKSKNVLKWDRKRKRYVRDVGSKESGVKKMKTESGTWISSSYKSGHYRKWKAGNRQEGMLGGEETEEGVVSRKKGGLWKSQKFKGNMRTKRKQVDHKNGKKGDGRLRTIGEIVKKREKMNFMKNRRQSKRSSRGRGMGGARGKGRKH